MMDKMMMERLIDAVMPNIGSREEPLYQCRFCLQLANTREAIEHIPYCRIDDDPDGQKVVADEEWPPKDILDIFYDPPRREGDSRQQLFGHALDQILEESEDDSEEVAIINLVGFRASAVDVGWLQNRIVEYWWHHKPDPADVRQHILFAISTVVQRTKEVQVGVTPTHIDILLRTKDDHGWYTYRFGAYIGRDTRSEQGTHLRAVTDGEEP